LDDAREGPMFQWLFGTSWPDDVPRFYPDLNAMQLAEFLSDEEFERIKSFENVYIVPFGAADGDPQQAGFGFALSRLLIRNLMLLDDVSIHGPEDTPDAGPETVPYLAASNRLSSYVGGVASCDDDGFTLHVDVYRPNHDRGSAKVQASDLGVFVRKCGTTIGR